MTRTLKELGRAALSRLLDAFGLRLKEPKNKWAGLDQGRCYRIENLGRPAVFYLPARKLDARLPLEISSNSDTVAEALQQFLVSQFGGYNWSIRGQFGVWRDGRELIHYDECAIYEVSFVGKERIPQLATFLAVIAGLIDEKCIYFKAGQYSGLIWPTDE